MNNIFKTASLLTAAVMLFGCEQLPDDNNGNGTGNGNGNTDGTVALRLVTDKDVIYSDSTDAATFTVLLGDEDVTAESVIYDGNNDEVSLDNYKFTTSEDGEYNFWATYGTYSTYDKAADNYGMTTIKAISVPVPEVVADPQPENTAFVHRAFLTQYTGTGCGYCPYMIKILRELMADGTIPAKAVLAAVHSYKAGDPAYISAPKVQNYPYLTVDILNGYSHTSGAGVLRTLVDESLASDAKAGISVNPKLYDDGTLVLKVQVKASVAGDYRVGAWLLEDDLYGQQEDYDQIGKGAEPSYDIHENCVRLIDSRYGGEWAGVPVGTLQPGQTADKTFVMNVKSSWKQENLHLALIVSTPSGSRYEVCNAIDCPIDAPTPFEYQK